MLLKTCGAQESALQTAGAPFTLSHLKVNLQILCPVLNPWAGLLLCAPLACDNGIRLDTSGAHVHVEADPDLSVVREVGCSLVRVVKAATLRLPPSWASLCSWRLGSTTLSKGMDGTCTTRPRLRPGVPFAKIHGVQELSPGAQQLQGYRPMSSEGKQGDPGLDLVLPRGRCSFSWASPSPQRSAPGLSRGPRLWWWAGSRGTQGAGCYWRGWDFGCPPL